MSAFSSYLSNHKEALLVSYARLLENFGQTLMTSTVVAISLALPLLLSIAISNLQALGESWDTEPKLTLYLNGRSREAAINTFLQELDDDSRIAKTTFISAEDALKEFEERSGFGEALAGLGHNPLPAAIELTPALGGFSALSPLLSLLARCCGCLQCCC